LPPKNKINKCRAVDPDSFNPDPDPLNPDPDPLNPDPDPAFKGIIQLQYFLALQKI
jgi:hypothetical protein